MFKLKFDYQIFMLVFVFCFCIVCRDGGAVGPGAYQLKRPDYQRGLEKDLMRSSVNLKMYWFVAGVNVDSSVP
jgi:hypothetical protein